MDNNKCMILINGEPKDGIIRCQYDKNTKRRIVTYANGQSYPYAYGNVEWLDAPVIIDKDALKIENNKGDIFNNIDKILVFKNKGDEYYRIFFNDGSCRSYKETELTMEKNVLYSKKERSLFDYYKQVAAITGLNGDDGTNSLVSKYEKVTSVGANMVLAQYLHPKNLNKIDISAKTVLFPFGCNLSQIKAVRSALSNQVSIIEGPPGTGKTQTILNIIANLIIRGDTVAVVSNNNDATNNVFEKLQKYGFDYLVAELGSSANKKRFIDEKQTKYPDFTSDKMDDAAFQETNQAIFSLEKSLVELLESKNKVALLKQELTSLMIEKQYFDSYFELTYKDKVIFKNESRLTSKIILELWNDCQSAVEQGKSIGFWRKLKYRFKYGVDSFALFKEEVSTIIPQVKRLFYPLKIAEVRKEIEGLETKLKGDGFDKQLAELTNKSDKLFKHLLARQYDNRERKVFTEDDLWKRSRDIIEEYPVILSSTYSAISSLGDVVYDYVIVDEASQVDLATGVLAMACARNIVVVGDLKQLPGVITQKAKASLHALSEAEGIPTRYRQEEQSLLSSLCSVFNSAPRTLLREHYRCHPKIIEFCNRKFYNGQLVIMTEDKGESDVLKACVTSLGNHARGHFNQRQIDEIQRNIIPELNSKDLGIISPYKAQTSALIKEIQDEIPISTVHKFQGRENDDIIISTVDNEITDFTDNPNMLNVAVSRAKKRLRIVISDNEKNENTNIGDLVKYIEFNNFEVKKSDIFSVFDMLYKCYNEVRREYLSKRKKVSEYDSENLMYAIIEEVLLAEEFSKFDVVSHQPLNAIINNLHKLDEAEVGYVMNAWTHVDFMIFNRIDKSPVLAVEVDGYEFHKAGTKQHERDVMKDSILERYNIPIIRFNTTGSMEKEKLEQKLRELLK